MRGLLLCVFMMLIVTGVAAQGDYVPPLVWQIDQTIIIQRDEVDRYKDCQPAEQIASPLYQSSDGRHFVVATHPAEVTLRLEEFGGMGGGPLPHNFWLCDMQTDTLYWIADQPDDFTFLEEGEPERTVTRSEPAWSPDGTLLIWTEQHVQPQPVKTVMVIYDTRQHTRRELDLNELPESVGIGVPYQPLWGDMGIVIVGIAPDRDSRVFDFLETLYVLDLSGAIVATWPLELDIVMTSRFLVRDNNGRQWLALYHNDDGWRVMDPVSGEIRPMNGIPELYSVFAPNATTLAMDVSPDGSQAWLWMNGITEPLFTYVSQHQITLSPDGVWMVIGIQEIDMWLGDRIETVPFTGGFGNDYNASLIWGPVDWRIRTGASRIFEQQVQCPGTLPARLMRGQMAQVITGTAANNLRDVPGLSGNVIGQIAGGASFAVLSDALCADGYTWYQVDYDGLIGWTAEATMSEYWLEPIP